MLVLGIAVSTLSSPIASAANTWNELIKQECTGSADAIDQCSKDLAAELKKACGAPANTKKYKNCKSTFIKDYGKDDSSGGGGGAGTGGDTIDGCGDIKTSIIKCNTQGGNPVMSILIQVINFLAVGVGIAVVGGIIWGGMLYASSNGDAGKAKQGVTVIVNAIVGLLLFMFMYALMNFIVPGGVFN